MAHDFSYKYSPKPSYCAQCEGFIWVVQHAHNCHNCGMRVHSACVAHVKKLCGAVQSCLAPANSKEQVGHLVLKIHSAEAVERTMAQEQPCYVKVSVAGRSEKTSVCKGSDPVFQDTLEMGTVHLDDLVTLALKSNSKVLRGLIGYVKISVFDLVKRPQSMYLLSKPDGTMCVKPSRREPTRLIVSASVEAPVPPLWPRPVVAPRFDPQVYHKHVMIMTRGTRGDVQPFVALARGLATTRGWMVTICTELRWKSFVLRNSQVDKGAVRFRPSGGDTMLRIDGTIAKWAMQHKSELMQVSMLARSEVEFFDSEPIFYYWAKQMQPDLLVYGFTLAALAMTVSQALSIPMVGFVLQPTCIPSKQYPAVVPISSHYLPGLDRLEASVVHHGFQKRLKNLMEQSSPFASLNAIRAFRKLPPQSENIWSTILAENMPVLVPIKPAAFGGKPGDWSKNTVLSDFIFLRGGGIPRLSDELVSFLEEAKEAGEPTVAIAFSSMPVSRELIMRICEKICTECQVPVGACELHTEDEYKYDFTLQPFHPHTASSFVFEVQANNDAHIALSATPYDHGREMYEILLGGWRNTQSVIRRRKNGSTVCTHQGAVLCASEFRSFWVAVNDEVLSVGRGKVPGKDVLLTMADVDVTTCSFVAFSTGWGSEGQWRIPSGVTDSDLQAQARRAAAVALPRGPDSGKEDKKSASPPSQSVRPRVIALVADPGSVELSAALEQTVKDLKSNHRLLELRGAPFGLLFSEVDCVIMHGGLGTTAEALCSGNPCMVTGVLLMDQRFWGHRVYEMGVGPEPIHVTDFASVCVPNVNEALRKDGVWARRAQEVARDMSSASPDGVQENVMELCRLASKAEPLAYTEVPCTSYLDYLPSLPTLR